jgi:hypothetical protein
MPSASPCVTKRWSVVSYSKGAKENGEYLEEAMKVMATKRRRQCTPNCQRFDSRQWEMQGQGNEVRGENHKKGLDVLGPHS